MIFQSEWEPLIQLIGIGLEAMLENYGQAWKKAIFPNNCLDIIKGNHIHDRYNLYLKIANTSMVDGLYQRSDMFT